MLRLLALAAFLVCAVVSSARANISITVATASGVLASHAYTMPSRVLAGPGWNGSAFTNGSAVCLFALTVAGTTGAGVATDFNAACPSGIEAAVGGGLDGSVPSGWSGATTVTSGGATFALLKKNVDYATHTGMACDDAAWLANTGYQFRDIVVNGGNCYQQGNVFGGANCTSGNTGGPTGTGGGITDGTCSWNYLGALTYSSNANKWPHEKLVDNGSGGWWPMMQYTGYVTVTYWWGGREIAEGANGEASPILLWSHEQYEPGDTVPYCQGHAGGTPTVPGCSSLTAYTLTVAPGDSFVDNIAPRTGPLAYTAAKGVAFHGTAALAGGTDRVGQALDLADSFGIVQRLQFKSDNAACLPTTSANSLTDGHTNGIQLEDVILDCGGHNAAVMADAAWILHNVTVTCRSTVVGSSCYWSKFQLQLENVTFYGPGVGVTNSTCAVVETHIGSNPIAGWNDNACFNFANSFAYLTAQSWTGSGNATSVASGGSGTFVDPVSGNTLTIGGLPGVGNTCGPSNSSTCFSLASANQFVSGASDLRLKSGADIIGAGNTYSINNADYWQNTLGAGSTVPGNDIFGTVRPQSSRYDVGAFEIGSPPVATLGGLRRWGMRQ